MKQIQSRKKLYDGLETQELYNTIFPVYDHAFPVNEMLRTKLLDLKTQIPVADFAHLIEASGIIDSRDSRFSTDFKENYSYVPFAEIENYESVDGLSTYYRVLRNDLLYLFSFGEVQPARYMLYSEGVWRIDPLHRFQGNMGEPDTVSSYILMFGVDPRTGQLPIKNLKQLHDTLIAKGCTQFYIAAEGIGGPGKSDVNVLDFSDGKWTVYYSGTGEKNEAFFTTANQDEVIVYYYDKIMSTLHNRHDAVIDEKPEVEDSIANKPQQNNPQQPENIVAPTPPVVGHDSKHDVTQSFVPFHDDDNFPEIKSHNTALYKKQSGQLYKLTAVCGLIAAALHYFQIPGSGLFVFFTGAFILWSIIFRFKQDSRNPAFSVMKDGVFINQQFLRNAFVPWENIAMAELRGYSDTPSITLTFTSVKTLLKGQFFVFRSLVKAQLEPTPTMVISGFVTEGDLKRTFAIMEQYLPAEKTIEAIAYDYEGNRAATTNKSTYVRLEDNRTKEYYREILDQALQQAEEEYRESPHSSLNESFFNQLTDIKKTVIEQGIIYSEAEADKRYPLGIMAVRNFDGYPDDWEYPKKLIDISSGISNYHQMPEKADYKINLKDESKEIENAFKPFFEEHNFKLKSSGIDKNVYENEYSELIFDFDNFGLRWGYMAPATLLYKNKANDRVHSVKELMLRLNQLDYETIFKIYFDEKRLGYYESLNEIVVTYLNDIFRNDDFPGKENANTIRKM